MASRAAVSRSRCPSAEGADVGRERLDDRQQAVTECLDDLHEGRFEGGERRAERVGELGDELAQVDQQVLGQLHQGVEPLDRARGALGQLREELPDPGPERAEPAAECLDERLAILDSRPESG
jgi:hypothetical protein